MNNSRLRQHWESFKNLREEIVNCTNPMAACSILPAEALNILAEMETDFPLVHPDTPVAALELELALIEMAGDCAMQGAGHFILAARDSSDPETRAVVEATKAEFREMFTNLAALAEAVRAAIRTSEAGIVLAECLPESEERYLKEIDERRLGIAARVIAATGRRRAN